MKSSKFQMNLFIKRQRIFNELYLRREAYGKSDPPLYWNSRKVPDAIIRARLGGWTSTHDMRRQKTVPEIDQHKVEDIFPVNYFKKKIKKKKISSIFFFKKEQKLHCI